jgi:molybdopterin-guanine dinucleotide biosynthesis protein A
MGFDKALLEVGGLRVVERLAAALSEVAAPVVEVGPGLSGLPSLTERPCGAGPLVALCAGARAVVGAAPPARRPAPAPCPRPVLVVACDMPFMTAPVLGAIARYPGGGSVVPLVKAVLQPLCARWSADDMALAQRLVASGERSMTSLLAKAAFSTFGPGDWPVGTTEEVFADADTPGDLEALGLRAERP